MKSYDAILGPFFLVAVGAQKIARISVAVCDSVHGSLKSFVRNRMVFDRSLLNYLRLQLLNLSVGSSRAFSCYFKAGS